MMKPDKLNVYIGYLFVLLIGSSITISTLHSHNHIEWHHPKKHVDTGTCLVVDSTECPICGYLFNAEPGTQNSLDIPLIDNEIAVGTAVDRAQNADLFFTKGRSPPVLI